MLIIKPEVAVLLPEVVDCLEKERNTDASGRELNEKSSATWHLRAKGRLIVSELPTRRVLAQSACT
jgi:hypothetical protein